MSGTIPVNSNKGPGRPATGIGPVIGVRLYPDDQAALEEWIAQQEPPKPSKPEAIRRLVRTALGTAGTGV